MRLYFQQQSFILQKWGNVIIIGIETKPNQTKPNQTKPTIKVTDNFMRLIFSDWFWFEHIKIISMTKF